MAQFDIRDRNYIERVRGSFARQHFMTKFGARLEEVGPGYVEIHLPHNEYLTRQHGFFHGGLIPKKINIDSNDRNFRMIFAPNYWSRSSRNKNRWW